MRPDQIRDVYDSHAARYDSAGRLLDRFVTRELREELGSHAHGEVLEIAIGTGLNLPHYSAAVSRVTGIDLSAGMLDQARQKAADLPFPVDLRQMDAEHLAFADDAFDTVVASEALCTVPHPDRAVSELFRVCCPGGTALFLEHVRSSNPLVYQAQRVISPIQERAIGCHWTRDTLNAIHQAGFQIRQDRSRLFDVFHMVVAIRP